MKLYYIIAWEEDCWDTFLEHQCDIVECYKIKEGYIRIGDYRSNPYDMYYVEGSSSSRKDFCFCVNKKRVFDNLDDAKQVLLEKIDVMYLSRCKHLMHERDNAKKKIKLYPEEKMEKER